MADHYTLTHIPYATEPQHKRTERLPLPPARVVTVADAIRPVIEEWRARGIGDIVVTRNGRYVENPDSVIVQPGDFIGVSARHGLEMIASLVWVALWNAGIYAGINIAAYAIAGAVIVGAGLMVTTILGAGKKATDSGDGRGMDSPSYGFSGTNPTAAGTPVPDVFGVVRSTPPIIGAYRTVSGDYSMWQHLLFAVHAGETNNPLSVLSVYAGDELLSSFANYIFGATDGSMAPDAAQIPQFDNTRHDRSFDRVLMYADTVTLETNGEADGITVIVEFPNGLFSTGATDGKIYGWTVDVNINYQLSGGGGTLYYDNLSCHTDGFTSTCRFSKTISFPARGVYTIYITRNTADDPTSNSTTRSGCYLISFQETLFLPQTHPGILVAQVSLKASENVSGAVPRIDIVHNRTAVNVRSWDDTTTQYVYIQNPMWAAYRMMTDPYNGLNISPLKLVQAAWTSWGSWCDGTVGGNTRCQCNLVVDTAGDFGSNGLAWVEDVGRARIVQYGDLWSVIVDQPRTSVYLFSSGNMSNFQWQSYEDAEKVDAIEIKFWNSSKKFTEDRVMAKASWYESLTTQPRISTVELRACNNAEQATREAILRMQKTELITRYGSFETGPEAMFIERGDVIEIIHPTNRYGFGGKLAQDHTAATTLYLDQEVTLATADYSGKATLYLINPDGERETRTITGPFDVATRAITISAAYTGYRWDTFAIGRPNDERLLYQVLDKKLAGPSGGNREKLQIDFVEYVDAVFYNAGYDGGAVAI